MTKYNMTFEEAQEYISRRGFDIPWNDCDVFVDERYITQTVANVLKWADDNPAKHTSDTDAFIEKASKFISDRVDIPFNVECSNGEPLADSYIDYASARLEAANKIIDEFKNYMKQ